MKKFLFIALLWQTAAVSAQRLGKKRIDPKSHKTTQATREIRLYNHSIPWTTTNYLGFYLEKASAAGQQRPSYVLHFHVVHTADYWIDSSSRISLTLENGQSVNLAAVAVEKIQLTGITMDPIFSGEEAYASFLLTPADLQALITTAVKSVRIETARRSLDYSINKHRSNKIRHTLSLAMENT
jgi:hypothetical protein